MLPHRFIPHVVFLAAAAVAQAAGDVALRNWPAWRGPLANGIAPNANPPSVWGETKNVHWKVEIPGRGSSTPIVWEDQIFLLTAIPVAAKDGQGAAGAAPAPAAGSGREGGGRGMVEQPTSSQQFVVLALDRATGKVRWQQVARTELPHEGHHRDHGYASASASTDGEVLVAPFGSHGLYVYDLQGRLLWQKDFGRMRTRNSFGEASSPTLHGDRVLVVWDHEEENDFIVALDRKTGRELWRQKRDEPTGWTTPYVVEHAGRKQVVVNATNRVRSYDFETGEVLWEAGGQTVNAIPMVVAGHGLAFAASGLRGSALYAIKLDARGDVTGTDGIAWSSKKATPYVPSPLLHGDLLYYFAGNNAQLSIADAKTGGLHVDAERLEGIFGVYASLTAAGDRVYVVGRDGKAWVLRHGPKLEVLAKNHLDDNFDASPAMVGAELFLRGRQHLYCIKGG